MINETSSVQGIIDQLNIIGTLKQGCKLRQNANNEFVSVGWSRTYRILNGDSRERTLDQLEDLAERVKEYVNSQDFMAADAEDLLPALNSAVKGLDLLKDVYNNDTETTDKIQKVSNSFQQVIYEKGLVIEPASTDEGFVLISDKVALNQHLKAILIPRQVGQAANIEELNDVSIPELKEVLKESFGDALVEEMVTIYFGTKSPVSSKEIDALLVGMVANLTYGDIQDIIEKKSGFAYEKIQDLLPESGNIRERDLIKILKRLRDVKVIDPKHVPVLASQYLGDYDFLVDCNEVDMQKAHNRQRQNEHLAFAAESYGNSERLARGYVYDLFQNADHKFREGILFPIYEGKNLVCRQACEIYNQDAVMAMGVSAVDGISQSEKIQVVFRGTYDGASVGRDFEMKLKWPSYNSPAFIKTGLYRGPGYDSYPQHREELLKNFQEKFFEKYKKEATTIEVIGHSLGSTDTQRFTMDLAKELGIEDSPYSQIKTVNLYGYNSPGVSQEDAAQFYTDVSNLQGKVNFNMNYLSTLNDVVHTFGDYLPGCRPEEAEPTDNIKRTFLRFHFEGLTHGTGVLQEAVWQGESVALNANNTALKAGVRSYKAHSVPYFKGIIPELVFFGTDDDNKIKILEEYHNRPAHIKGRDAEYVGHRLDTVALRSRYDLKAALQAYEQKIANSEALEDKKREEALVLARKEYEEAYKAYENSKGEIAVKEAPNYGFSQYIPRFSRFWS